MLRNCFSEETLPWPVQRLGFPAAIRVLSVMVLAVGMFAASSPGYGETAGAYWGGSYGLVIREDLREFGRGHDEIVFEPPCCRSWKIGLKTGVEFSGEWVNRAELEGVFQSVDVRKYTLSGGGSDLALGDWETNILALNGYRDFHRGSLWEPYLGVGFGGALVNVDSNPGGGRRTRNELESSPVVQAMLGVRRDLGTSMDGFLEYRYTVLTSDLYYEDISGVEYRTGGPRDHQLEFGLLISF